VKRRTLKASLHTVWVSRSLIQISHPASGIRTRFAYREQMADDMGGLVGELTLADASLAALVSDMRGAVASHGPVQTPSKAETTGKLADEMLSVRKAHTSLLPDDMREWLIRVRKAAEDRNKIVHAIGRDRCIGCGRSSTFEHKGQPVDRSAARVRDLIDEIEALLAAGVELARQLSDRLNDWVLREAKTRAAETNTPQDASGIGIGTAWHRCAACSDNGRGETVIELPAARIVVPPGTDLSAMLGLKDSSNES
jgi:hypothetical protein